jgi:hypothetical protein
MSNGQLCMDIILCFPSPSPQFPSLSTLVSMNNPKMRKRPQERKLVREKDREKEKKRT